jgi:hypothetical protein
MDHPLVFVVSELEEGEWSKPFSDALWPKDFCPKARTMIAVNKANRETLLMFREWLSSNLLEKSHVRDFNLNNIWHVYFEDIEDATMFFLRFT